MLLIPEGRLRFLIWCNFTITNIGPKYKLNLVQFPSQVPADWAAAPPKYLYTFVSLSVSTLNQ